MKRNIWFNGNHNEEIKLHQLESINLEKCLTFWCAVIVRWWWWRRNTIFYALNGAVSNGHFLSVSHSFLHRLKREEGGGQQIIIQTMQQPQQMQQQQQTVAIDHDEKKMRRQIANSNERRRMQSINAGFQSLRQLLPHHEGEKLSKVSNKKNCYY